MPRHAIPQRIKQAIRKRYAWPGGYPLYLICDDGAALCTACGKGEFHQIARSIVQGISDGWRVTAVDVNWENNDLVCDHCGEHIESAYP